MMYVYDSCNILRKLILSLQETDIMKQAYCNTTILYNTFILFAILAGKIFLFKLFSIFFFIENETYFNDDYETKKSNWKDFDFAGKMN